MSRERFDRRQFARQLALGTTVLPLAACGPEVGAALAEDDVPKPPEPKPEPSPSETDLLLELIRQRYPNEHLNEETLTRIRSGLMGILDESRRLGTYPLDNSDDPGFVFAAYRSDTGGE